MRILHLVNHLHICNGNVHAAIDLACAQAKAGDEVFFAAGDGELTPILQSQGIGFVEVAPDKRKPLLAARELWRLRATIARLKPDVLHAHMMAAALIGKVVAKTNGLPLVTTVHNAFDRHSLLMRVGDRVIAVSSSVGRQLVKRGFPDSKIRVVLNATLDTPRRDFFGRQPVSWPAPVIGTLCGMHDRKGVRDLLATFDIVSKIRPDVYFYLVGEGPSRADYEAIASRLTHADRIRFTGELRDTKSALAAMDIFALASHADPCPLVISEAREAGCAIVATNVDGIPEMLEGGRAGLLVRPKAPAELADALIGLLDDPERLRAMRAASAAYDPVFWSTSRVARQTRDVYKEVVRLRH